MVCRIRDLFFLQVALAIALLAPVTVRGQVQVGSAPQTVNQAAGSFDEVIAACLLLGNSEEIALAEFARDRADHADVRQFAEMLIRDHEQVIGELKQIAPQQAMQASQLRSSKDQGSDGNHHPQQGNVVPHNQVENGQVFADVNTPSGGSMASQLFTMQHRAATECLRLMKKELGEYQGSDFDKAFTGSQVACHIGMLAKLKASEGFASPRLKAIIEDSARMANEHLEGAKKLCMKLKEESYDQSDRRNAQSDRDRR